MKRNVFLFLLFFSCIAIQAQEHNGFTAFGKIPVRTPDSLLFNWRHAKNTTQQYNAAKQLFQFYETTGTLDSVLVYANAMDSILKAASLDRNIKLGYEARVDYVLGKAYQAKGLYDESLRHYLLGMQAGNQVNDKEIEEQNRFGQASVYFLRNETGQAITIFDELLKTSKNKDLIQLTNKQLGLIYLKQKDWDRSSAYFSTALKYFEQTDQVKNELEVRLNLGMIAEANYKEDSAFKIYTEVKDRAEQMNYYDLYIKAGHKMGDVLIKQKNYQNAQMLLTMVYANAIQWEDWEGQEQVLLSLQHLYGEMGDYKNAYAITTQLRNVTRQISENQNKAEVNELEIKYNTAQKEKEILQKENQLQQQRTIKYSLLIGFIVVLLPVIGLLYLYYQKLQTQSRLNATMEEANQQRITAMLKEKELEVLRASVDGEEKERSRISKELHDSIGGNLAAMKMQLSNNNQETEAIMLQLDDTYQQVRDISHNLAPKRFTNTGFIDLVKTYLQRFSAGGTTSISFNAYPQNLIDRLPTTLKVELYKILQELTTNAQKHAQATSIEIQLIQTDEELKLIFEDNGKGFQVDKIPTGIGLQNIRQRLKMFDGTSTIDSFPQRGTVIDITIPLNKHTNEA